MLDACVRSELVRYAILQGLGPGLAVHRGAPQTHHGQRLQTTQDLPVGQFAGIAQVDFGQPLPTHQKVQAARETTGRQLPGLLLGQGWTDADSTK
jgi:hypothetical protein